MSEGTFSDVAAQIINKGICSIAKTGKSLLFVMGFVSICLIFNLRPNFGVHDLCMLELRHVCENVTCKLRRLQYFQTCVFLAACIA